MITNVTKNTLMAENFANKSGLSKIRGLIFDKKAKAIMFRTRFGIHTFFMHRSIDLIVLDNKYKVVFLKESIKPNKIVLWNPKFNLIIELPDNSIKQSKTTIGDLLKISL